MCAQAPFVKSKKITETTFIHLLNNLKKFKKMKKLLQLAILFFAAFSFGQGQPTVYDPTLNTAGNNQISFNVVINPAYEVINEITAIVSESATFSPTLTNEIVIPIFSISGGTAVSTGGTITCLNSGQNYYIKIRAANSVGPTTSGATLMATTGSQFSNLPKLNGLLTSNITTTSLTLNLTIDNNLGVATTGTLNYSTTLPFSSNPTTVSIPTTSTDNASTTVNLSALLPGTTYYARVNLSNSDGCTRSIIYQFTTNSSAVSLLYHFPFNGNRSSIVNTGTFSTTAAGTATFVDNGLGDTMGALAVSVTSANHTTQAQRANLPLLPQVRTSRSIAMRINFKDVSLEHYVVSWGSPISKQSYGFEKTQLQAKSAIWADNQPFTDATTINTWVNLVITFDESTGTAVYYKNGNVVGSQIHNGLLSINTNTTNMVMGTSLSANYFGGSNFWIDDLKIYSGVLSASQVSALNSSLSNYDFSNNNLKFNLYPNPTNSVLNIDLANELQSVEIYSLQGQKVLSSTSKQISVADLSSGMYMVRVQDVDGGVATQKFMKM